MPPTEAMLGLTSPAEALVRLTAEWTLSHMSKPGGKMASPEDAVIRSFERQACDTGKTCPEDAPSATRWSSSYVALTLHANTPFARICIRAAADAAMNLSEVNGHSETMDLEHWPPTTVFDEHACRNVEHAIDALRDSFRTGTRSSSDLSTELEKTLTMTDRTPKSHEDSQTESRQTEVETARRTS